MVTPLRVKVGRRCGLFADFADYLRIICGFCGLFADHGDNCRYIAAKLPNGLIYSLT